MDEIVHAKVNSDILLINMSNRFKKYAVVWMNPLALLASGVLILLLLIVLCVLQTIPAIEQDLSLQAHQALSKQGLTQLNIGTDGRRLIVDGTVSNSQQRDQAIKLIRNIKGIDKVSNTIIIVKPSMPQITPDRAKISIVQTLPDNDNIDATDTTADEEKPADNDNDPQADVARQLMEIRRSCIQKAKNLLNQQPLLYETGQARLRPEVRTQLTQLMTILSQCPDTTIHIMGHTDSSGEEARNQQLSQARAQAILQFMLAKTPASTRLLATGVGASQPVADNNAAVGRALNRRVDLVFPED